MIDKELRQELIERSKGHILGFHAIASVKMILAGKKDDSEKSANSVANECIKDAEKCAQKVFDEIYTAIESGKQIEKLGA